MARIPLAALLLVGGVPLAAGASLLQMPGPGKSTAHLLEAATAGADDGRGVGRAAASSSLHPDGNPTRTWGPVGTVTFLWPPLAGLAEISYEFSGLMPGLHGLHVHEAADFSRGCLSTGVHYNPLGEDHGSQLFSQRHLGDLGNVEADARGVAKGVLKAQVPLCGPLSIVGRALVIHAGRDDVGLGGNQSSRTVGNSGERVACGRIVAQHH